jgi:predicted PurR-regulated permease PerM
MLIDSRTRAQLLILLLGVGLLWALIPFMSGLLGALVLYAICQPVHWRLARIVGPIASAVIVIIGATLLLLLPGAWLVGVAFEQAPAILAAVRESQSFERLGTLRIGNVDLGTRIEAASGTIMSWLSAQAMVAVGSAARGVLNLVVALFGLFYLLHASRGAWPMVRAYLPFSAASADLLRDRFISVTEATLIGIVLTAALQGTIVGLAFWLTGLPNAHFWGVLTAFASILPVLGSALVWLPATGVLVLDQRYGAAVLMLIMGAGIASNVDNVVRPIVYRRVSNIHPMTTVVGAFMGLHVFGLIGVLLGPLAITYFFELLAIFRREFADPGVVAGVLLPNDAELAALSTPVPVGTTAARD